MTSSDDSTPKGGASRLRRQGLTRRQALGSLLSSAALGAWPISCAPARPGAPGPTAPPTGSAPPGTDEQTRTDRTNGHGQGQEQPTFQVLDVAGTHRAIGRAIGETFRETIASALHEQTGFATCCSRARGELHDRVAAYERAVRATFPALMTELEGMAEGSNIPSADLFAWNCRSEIDAAADPCPPGCSTVGWSDDHHMVLAHNEDGNGAYRRRMFVVRVRPPSGVAFAALVYPGTLPGNGPGLNARGVVQTTNYISPCDAAPGIPRYFIGRAVLEARDLEHGVSLATRPDRAFPWHHNLASLHQAALTSLETWPGRHHRRDVRGLHLHTNHLLHPEMSDLPERKTYLARSSKPRLATLEQRLRGVASADLQQLLAALRDRTGTPCKVCRRPGDEVPGITLATAVFRSPAVAMDLYDGPSCGGPAQRVEPG